jgi:hypothetical protein
MKSLTFLLFFITLNFAMAVSPFVGTWKLVETYDEDMHQVDLPGGSFSFKIKETEESNRLMLAIKVGNQMSAPIFLEGDGESSPQSISFKGMRSTMMMPAENLFKLETYLTNTLPKMDSMSIENEILTFNGEGKIICHLEPSN